jgi:Tfp pilus assembly protein PilW
MLIGFVIGSVVIMALVKLVVANQRPVREPPRDLL